MNAFAQPPLDGRPKLVLRETPDLTDEDKEALRAWAPSSIFVIIDDEYNICDVVAGEQFFHTLPSHVMKRYKLANMLHPEDVPYVHEDLLRAQALEPSVNVLFRVWSVRGFYSAMEGASRFLIYSSSRSRVVYQVNRIVGPSGKVLDPEECPVLNVYQEKLHGIVNAVLDPRFVFINVSPASQTVLGCMPSWLVNSRLIDHVDASDLGLCEEFQRECAALVLTMPVRHSCRLALRRRDGTVRQFLVSVTPFIFPSLGTCFHATLQLLHDAARDSTLACSMPETSALVAVVAAAAPAPPPSTDTFAFDDAFSSPESVGGDVPALPAEPSATIPSAQAPVIAGSPPMQAPPPAAAAAPRRSRPPPADEEAAPAEGDRTPGRQPSAAGSSSQRRRHRSAKKTPPAVIDGVFCYSPQKRAYKFTSARKTAPADRQCVSCQSSVTPEWRRGPDGTKSLCNACGLMYAKLCKAQMARSAAADGLESAKSPTPRANSSTPNGRADASPVESTLSASASSDSPLSLPTTASPSLSSASASPVPHPQLVPLDGAQGAGKATRAAGAGRTGPPQMVVLSWDAGAGAKASAITATESPWGGMAYSAEAPAAPPPLEPPGSPELLGLDLAGLATW